jgi:hypothetical protein
MIGLTVEAQAVTSGSIKCVAFNTALNVFPVVVYFNPNATVNQTITRVRVFDNTGFSIFDQSLSPPVPVPGRGSFPISITGTSGGMQILINWQQGADAAPAFGRLNLITDNGVDVTSAAQSNCP